MKIIRTAIYEKKYNFLSSLKEGPQVAKLSIVSQKTPGKISVGDTVNIGGSTYIVNNPE